MNDLEITKYCAEAMGLPVVGDRAPVVMNGDDFRTARLFDPIHDDVQAMALVKKFKLDISAQLDDGLPWGVFGGDDTAWSGPVAGAENCDLNRAICECVAKMMKASHD